jgi:uncharacterized protein YjbI with pentapeptide repeats
MPANQKAFGLTYLWLPGFDVIDHSKFDSESKIAALPVTASLRVRDLRGAVLIGAVLRKVDFTGADLRDASLTMAHLEGATLVRAHLERLLLWDAHLDGAALGGAHLERANLWNAHLDDANLHQARLEGAFLAGTDLNGAHLSLADLKGVQTLWPRLIGGLPAGFVRAFLRAHEISASYHTNFQGADLTGANLEGANLSDATGLTTEQLASAHGDAKTKLPASVTRPASWPKPVEPKPEAKP